MPGERAPTQKFEIADDRFPDQDMTLDRVAFLMRKGIVRYTVEEKAHRIMDPKDPERSIVKGKQLMP